MSKRFPLLVTSALVLAACGGGGDEASGDSGSGDDWCALAQRIEDKSAEYDDSFMVGGDAFASALEDFASLLDDARGAAPAEISDAVDTTAQGVKAFRDVIADADNDLTKVDEEAFAQLEELGDEMDEANEQIEAYNLRECGITPNSDASDDGTGSDEPPLADVAPTTTTTERAADDPADDEPIADEGDDGDEIIEDPSDDMDDADSGDDVTFIGDSDSDWCIAARDVEAASDRFDLAGFGDPEAVEAGLGEILSAFEFALQFAPPELAFDLELSFASFQQLDSALAAAKYDFLDADLSILDDVDGSIGESNDRIGQYNEQVCGIPIDDDQPDDDTTIDEDEDGPDFDPTAGTVREQIVAELVTQGFTAVEAECIIDKIDFTDPDSLADREAIVAVFTACEISLERLAELAG